MERKYPLKEYQIWIGNFDLGQGYTSPKKPTLVAKVEATDFRVACTIYELTKSLNDIKNMIFNDQHVEHQSCRWFYNFDTNSNSWTGKYFETKKEAQATFNN